MARKIRKDRPPPIPPAYLFVELLIPWFVMGIAAVLSSFAGLSMGLIFIVSIGCAIAATFVMRELEKSRRRRLVNRQG